MTDPLSLPANTSLAEGVRKESTMPPHVRVFDFMMADGLGLVGATLMVYAVIFSYWLYGKLLFSSNDTLARRLGYRRETVCRALNELVQTHLVSRLDEPMDSGIWIYTIEETTLCEKVTGWCDISSQLGVTSSHSSVCASVTGGCDKRSHIYKIMDNTVNNKRDKGTPLPYNCAKDEECLRLWAMVVSLPKWANRSPEALAEAAKVLEGHSVAVCREMLRHTVAGGYPEIYAPSTDIIEKAKTAACEKKSHPKTTPSKNDDQVIAKLHPDFPEKLKESIYAGPNGQRGLRFIPREDGKVVITCPPAVRKWLKTIPDTLDSVCSDWVGKGYAGYTFV